MRAICSGTLLLFCFIWATNTQAQNSSQTDNTPPGRQPPQKAVNWDEPIRFSTKNKDTCAMVVSGQGNFTKLRVSCKTRGKSYWCDFLGKPNLCKSYNSNPRHFFTQIMWDLRKLRNACQERLVYKPQMCRAASDDVQMVFHNSWPKISIPKPTQSQQSSISPTKPPSRPEKPPIKTGPKGEKNNKVKPETRRKPTKPFTVRPTVAQESPATKMAEEYCWRSLHGFCRFFLSWFMN